MSIPIGPGDWVECVDALGREPAGTPTPLRVGAIYQVEDTFRWFGHDGLTLREVKPPTGDRGFAAALFRPIYRPKADLIESLKAPPKRVKEDA